MSALAIAFASAVPLAVGADSASLLAEARAALEAGEAPRAKRLAEEALSKASPDLARSLAIHREAQDVLVAAGAGAELVRRYDELLRGGISDPLRRYLRARVEPDPVRRRRDLLTVLAGKPDLFWAAYDLAELCAREGNWSRAVEYAERAASAAQSEAPVWNVLGHLRLEASRFLESPAERKALALEAKQALEEAVRLDPSLAEAHYNLGLVHYALGESARAKELWEAALRARPRFPEALNSLGHMASREGREDEAIAFYKKALEARPTYGAAHNNLAVSYYRKKDYARARAHLALAEAAGHAVAESFRRALARAVEEEAFREFQRSIAASGRLEVALYRPGHAGPVALGERDGKALAAALLEMSFRDSHGGVRLGERKVGGEVVARYSEAARLEIALGPPAPGKAPEKRTLIAIAREAGGRRELATWLAEGALRFSAEAPGLARELGRILSMAVAGGASPQ